MLHHSGRIAKILMAGVAVFLALSVFSSDPSPDPETKDPSERNCRNDWKKCGGERELLKNWDYELKKTK